MNEELKRLIGGKIKELREEYGYSMEEFGKRIGVTRGVVNNYEKGRITPKETVMKKIISLTDETEQKIYEFVFGSAREYLLFFFKDVLSLTIDFLPNGDFKENSLFGFESYPNVIIELAEKIDNDELQYDDAISILTLASEMEERLKNDPSFIKLWREYNLPSFTYRIENETYYREVFLPYLSQNFRTIEGRENRERYLRALVTLSLLSKCDYELFRACQDIEEDRYDGKNNSSPAIDLYEYFSEKRISEFSESEKKLLEDYIPVIEEGLESFVNSLEQDFIFPIELLLHAIDESEKHKTD